MAISMEEIQALLDKRKEEFVNALKEVCELESPTLDKARVDACANWFIQYANKHNWEIQKAPMEKAGDPVCITMNANSKNRPIAFSGHIDTVHAVGDFGDHPIRIDGDDIYGPGVCDCKGGVVAGLYAMAVLEELGYKDRPVQLLLQTDEENGSKESNKETIKWIGKQAKDAVAFFNLEGCGNSTLLCTERKGILRVRFDVLGYPVHSARCYDGINAIVEATYKIQKLDGYKDRGGITINIGTISGGTVPNTVAEKCSFVVDIRFASDEQKKKALALCEEVANTSYLPGTTCKISIVSERVAMEYSKKNYDLLDKMNEVFKIYNMPIYGPEKKNGGSDAADITTYGIPCVDSIGIYGTGIHSLREKASLSSMVEAAKRLVVLTLYIPD